MTRADSSPVSSSVSSAGSSADSSLVTRWTLTALFVVCIADPTGRLFHLKYPAFAAFAIAAGWDLFRVSTRLPRETSVWRDPERFDRWHIGLVAFFALFLPAYGFLMMRWRSGGWDADHDYTFLTAGVFLAFSLAVRVLRLTRFALDAAHVALLALAVAEIVVTALEIHDVEIHQIDLLIISRSVVITTRDYAGCTLPYVYLVACPLLLLPLARCWMSFFSTRSRWNLAWGIIVSAALIASGTRANQFMGLFGPVLFYVWRRAGAWWTLGFLAALIAFFIGYARIAAMPQVGGRMSFGCMAPPVTPGAVVGPRPGGSALQPPGAPSRPTTISPGQSGLPRQPSTTAPISPAMQLPVPKPAPARSAGMLSAAEHSNSIKLAYLPFYKRLFSDFGTLAFGQGFNARSWSTTVRDMLPENSHITELIYLEIVRIFGGLVAVLVALALAIPVFWWKRFPAIFAYCPAAWCFYMIVSMSNPYIFSSNGMLIFGLVLAAIGRARARKPA